MPFITARVNVTITKEQELKIKAGLGKAIELVPGKSEEHICSVWCISCTKRIYDAY